MAVNNVLLANPRLQKMPNNDREWTQYARELALSVVEQVKLGDGSLTTADGTTISGLDEMPGRVPSERSLPMAVVGNKGSIQGTSPLASSDAGASATITIDAHILKTPSGDVSYSAGSVTGLSYGTQYYVYADDEDFEGGAVTYLATTDATDIVGDERRYYTGAIITALQGTSGNISGITKGDPTTFTISSSAHGWNTGDTVAIADIVDDGPGGDIETTFNGNEYIITVTSTTEFTVSVDSSSLVNEWTSGGTATRTNTASSGGGGGGGGGGINIP